MANDNADVDAVPVSPEEELFTRLLILHLNTAFHAIRNSVYAQPEGLRRDIRRFFSRPIAKAVWEKMKPFQDEEFAEFIEFCRTETGFA